MWWARLLNILLTVFALKASSASRCRTRVCCVWLRPRFVLIRVVGLGEMLGLDSLVTCLCVVFVKTSWGHPDRNLRQVVIVPVCPVCA